MQPAEREHSSDLSHAPSPPWQSDVRDTGWEGPQAPPVAAGTSRLRRLVETVAACLASELVALVGKYFSEHLFFVLIQKAAYLATVSTHFPQNMTHITPGPATKDYFDQYVDYHYLSNLIVIYRFFFFFF